MNNQENIHYSGLRLQFRLFLEVKLEKPEDQLLHKKTEVFDKDSVRHHCQQVRVLNA